jgi:hypothetical protein
MSPPGIHAKLSIGTCAAVPLQGSARGRRPRANAGNKHLADGHASFPDDLAEPGSERVRVQIERDGNGGVGIKVVEIKANDASHAHPQS